MHEISLCRSILTTLEEAARREGFSRVGCVRLEIGRFAAVEIEALRFGFEVVAKGSIAEGAALEIVELPGRAACPSCGAAVEVDGRLDPCPRCGGDGLVPTGCDEMRIRDLEVT